jgi:hypothetical protein
VVVSADGVPVRSVLEAQRAELAEMSRYCERLERELHAANVRTAEAEARTIEAEAYATKCQDLASGMLWGFQLQDAAVIELLNDVRRYKLDDKAKCLIANIEATRRAGMRRGPVSHDLPRTLAVASSQASASPAE